MRKQSARVDKLAAGARFARRCFSAVRRALTRSVPNLNPPVFSVVIASEIVMACGGQRRCVAVLAVMRGSSGGARGGPVVGHSRACSDA